MVPLERLKLKLRLLALRLVRRLFDPSTTRTNLVRFGVDPAAVDGGRDAVVDALDAAGIGALRYGAGIRLVTHRRLPADAAARVVAVLRDLLG